MRVEKEMHVVKRQIVSTITSIDWLSCCIRTPQKSETRLKTNMRAGLRRPSVALHITEEHNADGCDHEEEDDDRDTPFCVWVCSLSELSRSTAGATFWVMLRLS